MPLWKTPGAYVEILFPPPPRCHLGAECIAELGMALSREALLRLDRGPLCAAHRAGITEQLREIGQDWPDPRLIP